MGMLKDDTMTHLNNHAFFTLPPEIHTHIFTLACTPNATRGCISGPSYCTASYTGIALSLVSKYIRAASAPARYRAVVIYGWREMLAFERILSRLGHTHSRVRYLTLVADEMPQDPDSLLSECVPTTSSNSSSSSSSSSSSALSPNSSSGVSHKLISEQKLLQVIAKILRRVGRDLYELEIGFQAIENVESPLKYLSVTGTGPHSPHSPLFFPCLDMMFYACPPSNELPWGMCMTSTKLSSSISAIPIHMITTSTESSSGSPANPDPDLVSPAFICPRLKELTVVCYDSCTSNGHFSSDVPEDGTEEEEDMERGESLRDEAEGQATEDSEGGVVQDQDLGTQTKFPSLVTLTLLASTPAQALTTLDMGEVAWDVGSNFEIDVGGLRRNITNTASTEEYEHMLDASETERSRSTDGPGNLRFVILRPKTRWNERWESLREVARRQREDKVEVERSEGGDCALKGVLDARVDIFVLKPGEQFDFDTTISIEV
ncbi:hypothetical protein EV361DRAFT_952486 [Lentinula raphanica]|uniref:Uncharacterized protein n=1 Tax=Lentinula raphanica TaxID=153919 RepID=A0AA38P515_9AGAR|nr:hypothetical protein F5880DRAFT_1609840 [Lentinula raphanica]KAJ3836173.1 hypothetical protein F5878DRAFT_274170 [Lentinula raphanica]KAJ3968280.1 hypothetical protein EV361DRAFT_952486 [Lentinula raphanica]